MSCASSRSRSKSSGTGSMIELTGADAREFKDRLRARLEKVETLTARLESSVGHASPP